MCNEIDQSLLETLARRDRETRRRKEQAFIEGIRTIKLELMLLRERDRVRELEHGEWAELEVIDT